MSQNAADLVLIGGGVGCGARVPVHCDKYTVAKDVTDTTWYIRVLHLAEEKPIWRQREADTRAYR